MGINKIEYEDLDLAVAKLEAKQAAEYAPIQTALDESDRNITWMTALLLQFKKQRSGRYRRSLRPRVERLFYKIKHLF